MTRNRFIKEWKTTTFSAAFSNGKSCLRNLFIMFVYNFFRFVWNSTLSYYLIDSYHLFYIIFYFSLKSLVEKAELRLSL